MKSSFFVQRLMNPGIFRRLVVGYLLTIVIAAAGIQIGQRWAYYRVRVPAQRQLEAAYKQSGYLGELQKNLLDTKGLILAYIQRPALLDSYGYHLMSRSQQLQTLLDDLRAEYASDTSDYLSSPSELSGPGAAQMALKTDDIFSFLAMCGSAGHDYERALTQLFVSIGNDQAVVDTSTETADIFSAINLQATFDVLNRLAFAKESEVEVKGQSWEKASSLPMNVRGIQLRLLSFLKEEPAQRLAWIIHEWFWLPVL
ncbi:MAG: hypothetical protein AB8B99_00455 [Phormidesmis sp.]